MHKCVNKPTSIGSDNGLSPGRRQAIIWTNVGMLINIGPLGTKPSKIFVKILYIAIQENGFENIVWKMAAILSWPQCVKHWCCVIVIVNYLVWSYWLWYETSISYWGLNKMVVILQTFSDAFYWTIFVVFLLKFHSSLFLWVQIDGLVQDCRGNAQNINN